MVCAPAIHRGLLWSCGDKLILDVIFGEYLVRQPAETIFYSAQLDFCSSLATLYLLMALSAWLVWRAAGWSGSRVALLLFFAQLALNLAWSGLFFGLRRADLALVDIGLLLTSIIATALAFRTFSSLASWLLVPYALWVAFATLLNFEIWRLNSISV